MNILEMAISAMINSWQKTLNTCCIVYTEKSLRTFSVLTTGIFSVETETCPHSQLCRPQWIGYSVNEPEIDFFEIC